MDRPSRVDRKTTSSAATVAVTRMASTSLEAGKRVKMVSERSMFTLEEKPITARFTVYSPVLVMMPARMEGTPQRVCSSAVTVPAQAPASMAAGRASQG